MIVLLTGVPGSGKTYRAVLYILEKLKSGGIVVSNVSGLDQKKLKEFLGLNEVSYLQIERDLIAKKSSFFAYSQFVSFCERIRRRFGDRKIFFVIDEAQRYLSPLNHLSSEIVYTFDYHRHLNVDFLLVTQHSSKIHQQIRLNAEYEIRAVRRSIELFPVFRYDYFIDNVKFKTEKIKPRSSVFALFNSFEVTNADTRRFFAHSRLLVTIAFFFVLSFVSFLYLRNTYFSPAQSSQASSLSQSSPSVPAQSSQTFSLSQSSPSAPAQSSQTSVRQRRLNGCVLWNGHYYLFYSDGTSEVLKIFDSPISCGYSKLHTQYI